MKLGGGQQTAEDGRGHRCGGLLPRLLETVLVSIHLTFTTPARPYLQRALVLPLRRRQLAAAGAPAAVARYTVWKPAQHTTRKMHARWTKQGGDCSPNPEHANDEVSRGNGICSHVWAHLLRGRLEALPADIV